MSAGVDFLLPGLIKRKTKIFRRPIGSYCLPRFLSNSLQRKLPRADLGLIASDEQLSSFQSFFFSVLSFFSSFVRFGIKWQVHEGVWMSVESDRADSGQSVSNWRTEDRGGDSGGELDARHVEGRWQATTIAKSSKGKKKVARHRFCVGVSSFSLLREETSEKEREREREREMERHDGKTSNRAQGERCKPEIGLWTGALQPRSLLLCPMCSYRDAVIVTDRWNQTLNPWVRGCTTSSGKARAATSRAFNIPKFNLQLPLFRVVWEIIKSMNRVSHEMIKIPRGIKFNKKFGWNDYFWRRIVGLFRYLTML